LHGDSSRVGKGHDEIIYKDAFVVELSRAGIPFLREKNYEITYKGVVLTHYYYEWIDEVRDDSCNSCPKFVAISVIGVYDAGAVTND
jgi:hypothetical protein